MNEKNTYDELEPVMKTEIARLSTKIKALHIDLEDAKQHPDYAGYLLWYFTYVREDCLPDGEYFGPRDSLGKFQRNVKEIDEMMQRLIKKYVRETNE